MLSAYLRLKEILQTASAKVSAINEEAASQKPGPKKMEQKRNTWTFD